MKAPASRPSGQAGPLLLAVLVAGSLLMLVTLTSLRSVRNSAQVAGIQRQDFQDLHAAQAGIVYTQNRLNQAVTLCHGYFSKQDSLQVMAAMTPDVRVIPSPLGRTRAFRVDSFRVVPGKPMRVRFRSTGGRWNGTTFDTASTHILHATLRMSTLGDYAAFVENDFGTAGIGVVNRGRVHARTVQSNDNVIYEREVTYVDDYNFIGVSNPPNTIFKKGPPRKVNGNPFTLDRVYIDDASSSKCNAHTYKDLAQGLVSGEGRGFSYTGSEPAIYVPLNKIERVGNVVRWTYYRLNENRANPPPQGGPLPTEGIPLSDFNGVIYSDKKIYMSGNLSEFSLTFASSTGIYITNNILCVGNEYLRPDNRVTLGLLTKDTIHYWFKCPTSIKVEATFVAQRWWVDGAAADHPGMDTLGISCSKSVANCWFFKRMGGAICKSASSIGPFGSYTRYYEFDPDMVYSPPPKFPSLYGQAGKVKRWELADLGEVN